MARHYIYALGIVTTVLLTASVVQAQNSYCDQLWMERNSIYKANGYCFKTVRGIRRFGNAGCYIDNERDLRLSSNQRVRVASIIREERNSGCR